MIENLFSNVLVRDNRILERYFKLIEHYVDNPHNGKGENHHILPKKLDGEDSPLVLLPYRAHYVAHHLLHKAVGGAMTAAFHFMVHHKSYPDSRVTSRVYDVLKEENAKHLSETKTGVKHSDETKKKMSESQKGRKVSAETRKKLSESNKGQKRSAETRKKMSESHMGAKKSAEHRKNISKAKMGHEVSDEHKKKLSESGKLGWKKRKAKMIFKLLNAKTDNNLLQTRT